MKRKGKKESDDLAYNLSSSNFLYTAEYVINLVELKLRMLQEEMEDEYNRNVVSSITSRIKAPDSAGRKLEKRGLAPTFSNAMANLNDIIGIRATCYFEDDILELVHRISAQPDITVVKEKDYITTPKDNGYKSFHLIIDIPVSVGMETKLCRAEIQFRTVAMDFWAQLDYQFFYKKDFQGGKSKKTEEKLAAYATEIAKLDRGMVKIRREIEKM